MNIGPMGNGRFDPKDEAILAGIGRWMTVNEASIRGTQRTPLPVQAWGESTRKGGTLYLHVFDWPRDGQLVVGGLRSDVSRAYLLGDPTRAALRVKRLNEDDVRVEVPSSVPDPADTVVVLEMEAKGDVATDAARLLSPTQVNTLRAFDGQRHGGLRFGAGKAENAYAENWTRPGDSMSWPVRAAGPVAFDVSAVYDAEPGSEGGTYRVQVGGQELSGTVQAGTNRTVRLGSVQLQPGRLDIRVLPREIRGGELLRLRSVVLTPQRS
jgi:alpha-L-fucosidase